MKIQDIDPALAYWESLTAARQHELEWMLPFVKAAKIYVDPDAAAQRILDLVGRPKDSARDWNMAVLLVKATFDIQDDAIEGDDSEEVQDCLLEPCCGMEHRR